MTLAGIYSQHTHTQASKHTPTQIHQYTMTHTYARIYNCVYIGLKTKTGRLLWYKHITTAIIRTCRSSEPRLYISVSWHSSVFVCVCALCVFVWHAKIGCAWHYQWITVINQCTRAQTRSCLSFEGVWRSQIDFCVFNDVGIWTITLLWCNCVIIYIYIYIHIYKCCVFVLCAGLTAINFEAK